MNQWYAKSPGEVLSGLGTSRQSGLSPRQAQERLAQYGPNKLSGAKKEPLWLRFLNQLRDPMILVLLAAAGLSLLSSGGEDWVEAVIILVIVLVNAVISITQENSAEKALEALQKMSAPLAKVIRGGTQQPLETDGLVPGDIIVLEAGDLVPADARILECANLKADESAMTGESVPVTKQAVESLPPETVLGDRVNMVISSTVITNGRAVCVVTGTGMDTEVGRIAGMLLGEKDGDTPLQRKMAEISKTLSFVCLAVCAVMFGVGLLYHRPILEMLMAAVSLAVAAIPEGLPAIVTIVLALGVQRMVKHNAIVKKLPAVETLGCAGVICSDKTGTLTMNRMTVQQVWTCGDRHRREVLTIGALCNDTVLAPDGKTAGDPTETAFVDAALLEGLDKNALERELPRVAELPFDSERKLMSTVHPLPGQHRPVYDSLIGGHVHPKDLPLVRGGLLGQEQQAPPAQQTQHRQVRHGAEFEFFQPGKEEDRQGPGNNGAVNGDAAVPDGDDPAPVQSPGGVPVEVQVEKDVIDAGTQDAAGHRPENEVQHVVLRQAVALGLLHAQYQARQEAQSQNDAIPIDTVTDVNGNGVRIEFPISEKAGKANGHVFQRGQFRCGHIKPP